MSENLHVSPSPIVRAGRIFKETRALTDSEIASHVTICGTANSHEPRTEDLDDRRRIERVGRVVDDRPSNVIGRLLKQFMWSVAVYRKYAKSDIDMVNAHSVAVLPVCYAVSRRTRARLVYDTHELETRSFAARGAQGLIFRLVERLLIRKCDLVFTVNGSISEWYESHYPGLTAIPIRNVPDIAAGGKRVDVRKLIGAPDDSMLFIHVGNLVGGRNIEAILEAFANSQSGAHVVFLGDGRLRPLVQEYIGRSENIHWLPPVAPEEVVNVVRGCDAALCLVEPTCLSNELALPNKAFEYALAGVPFVFPHLPEVIQLVGEHLPGWELQDPTKDLMPFLDWVDAATVAHCASALARIEWPSWDEESAGMIAAYRRMLGQSADANAG